MTFRERFLRGDCSMDAIEDWVEFWHTGSSNGQSLQAPLGLSDEEYQVWSTGGNQALAEKLTPSVGGKYAAVYLEWDDLGCQLEALVRQRLQIPCKITIKRVDYYFWEMSLDLSADVDEKLSERICERLGLRGIELDHFVDNDSVDNNQILPLLEHLTGREVSSSHADDYGVWIICKEYRTSSPEYAARLLSACEKRLRKELRSHQYPTVNRETARHQLFGFKEALKLLGIIPEEQWIVDPTYFSDCVSIRDLAGDDAGHQRLPTPEMLQRAMQCLIDNGIEPDEAETVLQALGYILFDADIMSADKKSTKHTPLDSRFLEQQQFIDEIAATLGCTVIRPSVPRPSGVPQPALLYLADDAKHNRAVDREQTRYSKEEAAALEQDTGKRIDKKYIYRDPLWPFQNTDSHGICTADFANMGQLNLRGDNWKSVIEGAMKLAYYDALQKLYAAGNGGYIAIQEVDDAYNDLNRHIIDALYKKCGKAFIGKINLSAEEREQVMGGKGSVFEEYTGQFIYNSECAFIIPFADQTLEQMILEWNQKMSANLIRKIISAIRDIGGYYLLWY